MTPETWLPLRTGLRRKYIKYNFLIMTFMIFILPINALDIPLGDLLVLSQFHCFDEYNICTSRLEYCNSFARECRPCTADICARKGGDDFPLQCSLNCSIAQARLAASKATDKLRELNETNSDIRALNIALNISISDLKTQNQGLNKTLQETKESLEASKEKLLHIKQEVDVVKDSSTRTIIGLSAGLGCSFLLVLALVVYRKKCHKSTINKDCCLPMDEECALVEKEEDTSRGQYCEEKLKGTCETNADTQKTIATTQDKGFTSPRINPALQSNSTTKVTEDKESDNTESKQADDSYSKTVVVKTESDSDGAGFNGEKSNPDVSSGFDSAPLKNVPSLDLKTFAVEEIT